MTRNPIFFDIECYPNYFLICFEDLKGTRIHFSIDEDTSIDVNKSSKIRRIMTEFLTVGFNSKNYDIPMILSMFKVPTNKYLKDMSDMIINTKNKDMYQFKCVNNLWKPKEWGHVDLMQIVRTNDEWVKLKLIGCRLGSEKIQDLPYNVHENLNKQQRKDVLDYCWNDIGITKDLYNEVEPFVGVREYINKEYEKYKIDVRDSSNASIVETLIKKKYKNVDIKYPKTFNYSPPSYLKFNNDDYKEILLKICGHEIMSDNPKETKEFISSLNVNLGELGCGLGIGGAHSKEEKRVIIADNDSIIIDVDVASYYPNVMIANKYYPENLKNHFENDYVEFQSLKDKGKENNNFAVMETFKLLLNIPYGKLNDKFSLFYAPHLAIHVTLTGQLSLIMLCEMLMEHEIEIISVNTDGITSFMKKSKVNKFRNIVKKWEELTKLRMEESIYTGVYSRSVNSYIAIKEDGSCKLKGDFGFNLRKNSDLRLCKNAVIKYITEGVRLEDSIYNNVINPIDICVITQVNKGGFYKDESLGKVVRFYYSTTGDKILTYNIDNEIKNKVSLSDGCRPLMDFNEPIVDLDLDRYYNISVKLLKDYGVDYV